jgi:hypothetical protein
VDDRDAGGIHPAPDQLVAHSAGERHDVIRFARHERLKKHHLFV